MVVAVVVKETLEVDLVGAGIGQRAGGIAVGVGQAGAVAGTQLRGALKAGTGALARGHHCGRRQMRGCLATGRHLSVRAAVPAAKARLRG